MKKLKKELRGDTPGAADSRDMPNRMLTWSAYKAAGKKEGGNAQSDDACLPKSPLQVKVCCFSGEG